MHAEIHIFAGRRVFDTFQCKILRYIAPTPVIFPGDRLEYQILRSSILLIEDPGLLRNGTVSPQFFRQDLVCAANSGGKGAPGDLRHIAPGKGTALLVLPRRDPQLVGQCPGGSDLKILAGFVAQSPQNEGDVLVGLDGGAAVVGSSGVAVGQAIGVGVADVGPHRVGDISEGDIPGPGLGLVLFAQQPHQHDDGLIAGGRLAQVIDGRAIRVGPCSLEQAQLVQHIRRLGGLVGRQRRRDHTANQKQRQKCRNKLLHMSQSFPD